MSELWVQNFSISLDGYGAGPGQGLDHPLGVGGERLHEWIFPAEGTRSAVDERFFTAGLQGAGATIMGRNMFGPVRGPWDGDPAGADWTGWWGEDPPFHHDVFVLTHHARPPVPMAGGTTFHFVTDGIEAALKRARAAAAGAPVRLGGGVSTVGSTCGQACSTNCTSSSSRSSSATGSGSSTISAAPSPAGGRSSSPRRRWWRTSACAEEDERL